MTELNIVCTAFGIFGGFLVTFITMKVHLNRALEDIKEEKKISNDSDEKIIKRLGRVESDMTKICTTCPDRIQMCMDRWKANKDAFDKAFKEIRYNKDAILTMENRILKELNETMYKNFSRAIASLVDNKKG